MVDFKPNDKQDEEFKAMFEKSSEIGFNEFLLKEIQVKLSKFLTFSFIKST